MAVEVCYGFVRSVLVSSGLEMHGSRGLVRIGKLGFGWQGLAVLAGYGMAVCGTASLGLSGRGSLGKLRLGSVGDG